MKKFALIMFVALSTMLTVSCTKEKTLKGTTWESILETSVGNFMEKLTLTIHFSTETEVEVSALWEYSDGDSEYESTSGTYTYSDNSGTITIDGDVEIFTISDNVMTIEEMKFYKK